MDNVSRFKLLLNYAKKRKNFLPRMKYSKKDINATTIGL